MEKVLVIGACGQIGSELTLALRGVYGTDAVIATDINKPEDELAEGPFFMLNILQKKDLLQLIEKHEITQIYLLAAILSAKGEANPRTTWELNMEGLLNVLEYARNSSVKKVFWPSSIAVFGSLTPKVAAPQDTIMNPDTVYGISKLAGERLCEYYFEKFKVDVRSLRFPGLIGYKSRPGGGTTDFAVDIFHKALKEKTYECFLAENTLLPMMYMDDAVRATLELMDADSKKVKVRSSYNISAMSFSPAELFREINRYRPDFTITYKPDFRQKIADNWPNSIDDTQARKDWAWEHQYGLTDMVKTMLSNLEKNLINL